MNKDDERAFMIRWLPAGFRLLKRAEACGIDWRNTPIEKLETAVIFAESYSDDEKLKLQSQTKGSYHGK